MIDLDEQKETCREWGAPYLPVEPSHKIGISKNLKSGKLPVNGLRHLPTGDTSGWFIWAGGEPSTADDFFVPLHAAHIGEYSPKVKKYLGLAPGWRFLIAPEYEDVWFDASLLKVD